MFRTNFMEVFTTTICVASAMRNRRKDPAIGIEAQYHVSVQPYNAETESAVPEVYHKDFMGFLSPVMKVKYTTQGDDLKNLKIVYTNKQRKRSERRVECKVDIKRMIFKEYTVKAFAFVGSIKGEDKQFLFKFKNKKAGELDLDDFFLKKLKKYMFEVNEEDNNTYTTSDDGDSVTKSYSNEIDLFQGYRGATPDMPKETTQERLLRLEVEGPAPVWRKSKKTMIKANEEYGDDRYLCLYGKLKIETTADQTLSRIVFKVNNKTSKTQINTDMVTKKMLEHAKLLFHEHLSAEFLHSVSTDDFKISVERSGSGSSVSPLQTWSKPVSGSAVETQEHNLVCPGDLLVLEYMYHTRD